MKFSDYSKNNSQGRSPKEQLSPDAKKMLGEFLTKYNGKSQAELIEEIEKVASEQRLQGKLTDQDIDSFYSMLSPFLKADERVKLNQIRDKLKNL